MNSNPTPADTDKELAVRIEEREFVWKLINDVRYEHMSLDEAKHATLDRLSEAQTEQDMRRLSVPTTEGQNT